MVFQSILFEGTEDGIQKEALKDPAPSSKFTPSSKKKMEIPPLDELRCPKCREKKLRHYGDFSIFCLSCGTSYTRELYLMPDGKYRLQLTDDYLKVVWIWKAIIWWRWIRIYRWERKRERE